MYYSTLPPLRDVVRTYDLIARKALGQHFLFDANLTDRIVRSAGPLTGLDVIEVGPGPGGLTRSLLNQDLQRVIAIETDPRCLAALKELVDHAQGRLILIAGDALSMDVVALSRTPRAIVANLPYSLSIPLLLSWLEQSRMYHSMTLMFQKEVALRLCARPATRDYGRLSVMTQWRCHVRWNFSIPARAFVPPPKVDSAVVTLTPRDDSDHIRWEVMELVTKMAFNQRRKMVRSSLKGLGHIEQLLNDVAIATTQRAETIDVGRFMALAYAYQNRRR